MLGKSVGKYRVTQKLAQGGAGEIYAARHELMERDAVVKVLRPEKSANKRLIKRFFNEARAAARIRHPGIVEIFDMGYADDGRAFIVMERLDGETLAARIRRGKMSADDAIAIARQLASALGAAHAHQIVHRDLKPDNIYVVPDPDIPSGERIKILDFGIAKLHGAGRAGSVVTAVGTVVGTPAYMSPEQCLDSANVDLRTDLYALGCILYECLCGRPPFGHGGLSLLEAHLNERPLPMRALVPSVPPELESVVNTLLAKRPTERYASCDALIEALDALAPEFAPRRSGSRVAALAQPSARAALPGDDGTPGEARAARANAATALANAEPDTRPAEPVATATQVSIEVAPGADLGRRPRRPRISDAMPASRASAAGEIESDRDATSAPRDVTSQQYQPSPAIEVSPSLVLAARPRPSGDSRARARPKRARWWLAALGIAAVLGVGLAIVIGVSGSGEVTRTTGAANPDIRTASLAAQPLAGASRPGLEPAAAPGTARVVPGAVASAVADGLRQGREALRAERWADALSAAERVAALEPGNQQAQSLAQQARAETESERHFHAFTAAAEASNHEAAAGEFAAIAHDSVYRDRVRQVHDRLRLEYIEMVTAQARRLADGSRCNDVDRLIQSARGAWSEAGEAIERYAGRCKRRALRAEAEVNDDDGKGEASARNTAGDEDGAGDDSTGDSDGARGDDRPSRGARGRSGNAEPSAAEPARGAGDGPEPETLRDEVRSAFERGRYGQVLRMCDAALAASPGEHDLVFQCAVAACRARNAARAKRYMAMQPSASRRELTRSTCLRSGFEIE